MDLPDPDPRREPRRGLRRDEDRGDGEPLEQRLDRWVSAGRQLVDGVSGGRPGSRSAGRGGERRSGGRGGLGRWVENRLDWLLEDGDDWREPWQEPQTAADQRLPRSYSATPSEGPSPGRQPAGWGADASPQPERQPRRPLEAISRRGHAGQLSAGRTQQSRLPAAEVGPSQAPADDWPDDDSFNVPRWQRSNRPSRPVQPVRINPEPTGGAAPASGSGTASPGRSLPRSSRRR